MCPVCRMLQHSGMASVTDLYSSLQEQRVRESEKLTEIEREDSKTRGDYASTIWEQRYVSEPIETKYFKFLTVDSIREQWDLNS